MKKILFFLVFVSSSVFAQVPGDTLIINSFNYANAASKFTRDTIVDFPNNASINYSKVYMLYNMRCKDGLVSAGTAGQTNKGCGEWDYSCNTYLTDSTRLDSLPSTIASHSISNFNGSTYNYITQAFNNYYSYPQWNTSLTSIVSETQSTIGTGALSLNNVLQANAKAGRSQYLFTAAELLSAGVLGGDINGIILNALNASTVNFLEINFAATSLTSLNASSPILTGFTNVYNSNTNFVAGNNRLQFYQAFLWDGISNIIVDFSFTNSIPSNSLSIVGASISNNYGLIATEKNYINTSGGGYAAINTSALGTLNSEITVAFWSKGNPGLNTVNTSILEGSDNANNRQLNIHLPWSNSNVYFDCGNAGSGYDRINKLATTAEITGTWQHWAFTKNTSTGIMNIYLNGILWHSGTGKTLPINITSLVLGIDKALNNIYGGAVDELSIFNSELSAATIQSWMNKSITSAHPNYSNLVAYYPLNEGVGSNTNDASVNAQVSNFINPTIWNFARGNQINRFFAETMERPNITFLQGVYVLSNTSVSILDSIPAIANLVKSNTVYPNQGMMKHDSISTMSNQYWNATYAYTFDGITGLVIDSIAITPTNTITITQLPYTYRYPSKYELMSFVTPYGINLDLGIAGKTWTFDITDYLPILKGKKRLTMERGGERQEDMDIKFLFIVGTPTRDVKEITQLWRQPANCNYTEIINNKYFEPRSVPTLADAKYFKTRTMITGHGQEGEFIPQQHFININAGAEESIWTVEKKCGYNPVYPQGGTWIYDRAGWCPGMATDLHEVDITSSITPGQNAIIDYGMYTASGDSRYLVSNYLVQYGNYNYTLDASLVDVLAPTNKIEYAREQAICAKPKIKIQNTCSVNITSIDLEYWVNSNTNKNNFSWTGTLLPNQTVDVELPVGALWTGVTSADNDFHARILKVNSVADQDVHNNYYKSNFKVTGVAPSALIVYHKSNLFANETSYKIVNEQGSIVLDRNNLLNNTIYRDTLQLPGGCYKLIVTDTDGDGISFWANSDGAGSLSFRRTTGTLVKTFNPDFGSGLEYNFTTDYPLTYEQLFPENSISIYPNPSKNNFIIEGENIASANIKMFNNIGQQITFDKNNISQNKLQCITNNLPAGVYTINVFGNKLIGNFKLVIE
jgi:hypothetical protein